jgi:hypothetical protein
MVQNYARKSVVVVVVVARTGTPALLPPPPPPNPAHGGTHWMVPLVSLRARDTHQTGQHGNVPFVACVCASCAGDGETATIGAFGAMFSVWFWRLETSPQKGVTAAAASIRHARFWRSASVCVLERACLPHPIPPVTPATAPLPRETIRSLHGRFQSHSLGVIII